MPGKKGMHWNKPKIAKKKLNTLISNTTYSKLKILSNIGFKLKKRAWSTPSAIAATIIEENVDTMFNKIGETMPDIIENDIKKKDH